GKGDGPASAGLAPKPRDYTSPEWQDSVTDEHIAKIIKYGGAAVGKSPMMPANPDLTAKDEVVAGLVEHIRGLKGK
ncbi:MAG: cytochrome c, partial [Candidatus Methylomirabilis sp.]|nr:cytochrome c [Deltaproteobacteria bacterium]